MLRFVIILLAIGATFQSSYSQSEGWRPAAESFSARYDSFPDTEAIILEEKGFLSIVAGEMRLLYSVKIHILKEKGRDYGEISLGYYNGEGEVEVKRANSFNLNEAGEVERSTLLEENILSEELDDKYTSIRFNLPEVRIGTIINYVYEKTVSNPYRFSWRFQNDIPTLVSTFGLDYGSTMAYSLAFLGPMASKLESLPSDEYRMENIPAKREEPYVPNEGNYEPHIRIEFSHTRAYGPFSQSVFQRGWKYFGKEFRALPFVAEPGKKSKIVLKKVKELCEELDDPELKAREIYRFIQSNINWDEKENIIPSQTPYEVLTSLTGNTADINNLLFHMLRMAGLEVSPALVGTRGHSSMIPDFYIASQFNNLLVTCRVGEKEYALDATDPYRPFGLPAARQLNGIYLVMNQDSAEWKKIPIAIPSIQSVRGLLTVDTDGQLSGKVTLSHTGYSAVIARSILEEGEEKDFWRWRMDQGFDQNWISESAIIGVSDPDSQITVSATLNIPDFAMKAGEYLYLQPILVDRLLENPFKDSVRLYPIDFPYPLASETRISYLLPEGYAPDDRPDNAKITLPNGEMSFVYITEDLGFGCSVMNQLILKETFYEVEEYGSIKQVYDEMIKRHGQQLVLKRKSGE